MNACITLGSLFVFLAAKKVIDILKLRIKEEKLELPEDGKAV